MRNWITRLFRPATPPAARRGPTARLSLLALEDRLTPSGTPPVLFSVQGTVTERDWKKPDIVYTLGTGPTAVVDLEHVHNANYPAAASGGSSIAFTATSSLNSLSITQTADFEWEYPGGWRYDWPSLGSTSRWAAWVQGPPGTPYTLIRNFTAAGTNSNLQSYYYGPSGPSFHYDGPGSLKYSFGVGTFDYADPAGTVVSTGVTDSTTTTVNGVVYSRVPAWADSTVLVETTQNGAAPSAAGHFTGTHVAETQVTVSIDRGEAPVARIQTVDTISPNTTLTLLSNSYDPDNPGDRGADNGISAWAWTVTDPDGIATTGASDTFPLTPTKQGAYKIRLRVMDDEGGFAETTRTLNVRYQLPRALFDRPAGQVTVSARTQPVRLTSRSYDPDNLTAPDPGAGIVTHFWRVTDPRGEITTFEQFGLVFDYTPQFEGTHKVELVVIDDDLLADGLGQESAPESMTFEAVGARPDDFSHSRNAQQEVAYEARGLGARLVFDYFFGSDTGDIADLVPQAGSTSGGLRWREVFAPTNLGQYLYDSHNGNMHYTEYSQTAYWIWPNWKVVGANLGQFEDAHGQPFGANNPLRIDPGWFEDIVASGNAQDHQFIITYTLRQTYQYHAPWLTDGTIFKPIDDPDPRHWETTPPTGLNGWWVDMPGASQDITHVIRPVGNLVPTHDGYLLTYADEVTKHGERKEVFRTTIELVVPRRRAATNPQIPVGSGPGTPGRVTFRTADGAAGRTLTPYGEAFTGGVRTATADLTGDGVLDVVTAPASAGAPNVVVFDGATGAVVRSFLAYEPTFTGGLQLAAGDVTGDGVADVVTGTGAGGAPLIRVFDGRTGAEVAAFFAYEDTFRGGVQVAVGDVDGDGTLDLIAGTGVGGGPRVRVLRGGDFAVLFDYFAYDSSFRGGVNVAAADTDGDGRAEIYTGTGVGGGPHVAVFDPRDGRVEAGFFAYDPSFRGGVSVAARDLDGDGTPEVITAPGPGGAGHVRVWDSTGEEVAEFLAFDPTFIGGVYVS